MTNQSPSPASASNSASARLRRKPVFFREQLPRILVAALGGYALCWALVSLLCAWLPMAKASRWFLTGQLVPIPMVAVLLWAFAARNLWRATLTLLSLVLALQALAVLR